jgi:hypothetical protein
MKKAIYLLSILVIVGLIFWFGFYQYKRSAPLSVLSFEDCVNAGYPVMESFPRQCKTPDGRTYAEELPGNTTYDNASLDLINIDVPFSGAVVGKDFSVIGKARGMWFFEASFPIQVIDKNGYPLATGIAQAQSDWMTENFVPFKADIKVPENYIGPATLILKKDNPSGLLSNEASISFPINIEY